MCGGKMRKVRKFNAAMVLGSLTAAVALLAGAPGATAQTAAGVSDDSVSGQAAPGGGSFPGSFLVPGTNTSIHIGGLARGTYIWDASAPPGGPSEPDVTAVQAIPLEGSAAHQLHGGLRFHARQSNIFTDVRTPTPYGELDTFILLDFFGQNTAAAENSANTQNARLVLAYGTLGPLLAGQTFSLWFDGDALPETVDPTPTIGVMNGLTNRKPQLRYTFAAGGGFSVAGSIENPEAEGISNAGVAFTTNTLGGIDRYPDFAVRARLDQAWGHVALTGLARQLKVTAPGAARVSKEGWGVELTGHLNTFGKDTLKGQALIGQGLGNYMSDYTTIGGLQANLATGAASTPLAYGLNLSYTHFWTATLRSTVNAGYSHLNVDSGILGAVAGAVDKRHIGATGNLFWSPVPQVDLGIEYEWAQRTTHTALLGGNSNKGEMNRVEAEAAFKF